MDGVGAGDDDVRLAVGGVRPFRRVDRPLALSVAPRGGDDDGDGPDVDPPTEGLVEGVRRLLEQFLKGDNDLDTAQYFLAFIINLLE